MNYTKIHNELVNGRLTIPVSILVVLLLRLLAGVKYDDWVAWGIFFMHVLIGILFMRINHSYPIIEKRTIMPSVFFLLFTGTNPFVYYDLKENLICVGMVLCVVSALNAYQNRNSQIDSFNISLILSIIGIFSFPFLLFIPFFWYVFYKFKSLNFRSFFASFAGILTVCMFLVAWCVYKDDFSFFMAKVREAEGLLLSVESIHLSLSYCIYIGFIFVLLIISKIHAYLAKSSEKIRTNAYLQYLYLMSILVLIFSVLFDKEITRWMLILYIPVTLLAARYFTLTTSKFSAYLLLFVFCFFLGMYFWDIYGIGII